MQIIKIAIAVLDIILAILIFFFSKTEKKADSRNFFRFLMFLFCTNAVLIFI